MPGIDEPQRPPGEQLDRPPDERPGEQPDRPAGDFSAWLEGMQGALRGERDADVPCAGCTACCRASQFVHIAPDEVDTLSHIPSELLFPAPRLPAGHVVLGYDERGRCPMLGEGGCSIYEHRPRTCRTYDCRVFPAAGVDLGDGPVAPRARSWRFDLRRGESRTKLAAVGAAASFLREHADLLGDLTGPVNPTRLAVAAVEVHDLFVASERHDATGPAVEEVRVALTVRALPAPVGGGGRPATEGSGPPRLLEQRHEGRGDQGQGPLRTGRGGRSASR